MAFVGPRRRQAEMEEIIAEMLFYWGYAGISLAGMEKEVRNAASVYLFAPNWSWEEDEWVQQHSQKNPPHDKFTRHHFLRALVKGFEELWQKSRKATQ